MRQLQFWMGDVAGVTDDGPKSDDTFEKTGSQGHILDFIHVAVIFFAA